MRSFARRFAPLGLTLLVLAESGCAYRYGTFPLVSGKLIDLSAFDLEGAEDRGRVTGRVSVFGLLFVSGEVPTFEGALEDALDSAGGDVLQNATATESLWGLPPLLWWSSWTVTGDALRTRKDAAASGRPAR